MEDVSINHPQVLGGRELPDTLPRALGTQKRAAEPGRSQLNLEDNCFLG